MTDVTIICILDKNLCHLLQDFRIADNILFLTCNANHTDNFIIKEYRHIDSLTCTVILCIVLHAQLLAVSNNTERAGMQTMHTLWICTGDNQTVRIYEIDFLSDDFMDIINDNLC